MNKELENSKRIFLDRKFGNSQVWSAYTECIKCGKPWLWGVKENLSFICPEHTDSLEQRAAEGDKQYEEMTEHDCHGEDGCDNPVHFEKAEIVQ